MNSRMEPELLYVTFKTQTPPPCFPTMFQSWNVYFCSTTLITLLWTHLPFSLLQMSPCHSSSFTPSLVGKSPLCYLLKISLPQAQGYSVFTLCLRGFYSDMHSHSCYIMCQYFFVCLSLSGVVEILKGRAHGTLIFLRSLFGIPCGISYVLIRWLMSEDWGLDLEYAHHMTDMWGVGVGSRARQKWFEKDKISFQHGGQKNQNITSFSINGAITSRISVLWHQGRIRVPYTFIGMDPFGRISKGPELQQTASHPKAYYLSLLSSWHQ